MAIQSQADLPFPGGARRTQDQGEPGVGEWPGVRAYLLLGGYWPAAFSF